MSATLEVRELTVRYGEGRAVLTAVDNVSFTIQAGGTLGLVGESGCGKSTIARAITGLVPIAGGRILVDGVDQTTRRDARSYRRRVQMIFQDPYASLNPRMTVGEAITEGLRLRSDADGSRRPSPEQLLDMVGLARSAAARYPHQFSGGQQQRIAIARALAVHPDVIVLDEVTSSLDVSVQATILNLLKRLQVEFGLSYLLITHDLSVVRYMSHEVAVMYLGRIVETADNTGLFTAPVHPYTDGLIASIPQFSMASTRAPLIGDLPDPRKPPTGCRFHTRCPVGPQLLPERTVCIAHDPHLGADGRPHRAACHFVSGSAVEDAPRIVHGQATQLSTS
jgi:oligopeptide/dipeptide ABC transporter ATP-binding protein